MRYDRSIKNWKSSSEDRAQLILLIGNRGRNATVKSQIDTKNQVLVV